MVAYSADTYLSNPKRVLARRGENRFSGIADLRSGDFTVAAQEATTNYAAALERFHDDSSLTSRKTRRHPKPNPC